MITASNIPWESEFDSDHPLGIAVATESNAIADLFETAADVAKSTPESVDWIVPGFIAAGVVTEVDGKLKASGKTTWIGDMVSAILSTAVHGAGYSLFASLVAHRGTASDVRRNTKAGAVGRTRRSSRAALAQSESVAVGCGDGWRC